MDVLSAPAIESSLSSKTQIIASEVPHILDSYLDKIKILSLDCFDTLLWRKTAAPKDVFYAMQQRPLFQELGVTAYQRMASAARAYRAKFITDNQRQVSLSDIYHFFTSLTEEQKNALADEELQAEIEACYPFPPFVELIRQAAQRGIKVIIVSDIYMTEKQLRKLLASHLSHDVMQAIEKIFCSLEYGKSKSDGLFQDVLANFSEPAQSILHIGDHLVADFESPQKMGLRSLHFMQFPSNLTDFLRQQNSAASLAFLSQPGTHHARDARYSPFRGVFSLYNHITFTPENLIGYMTFGPMLYAFARFISDELEALRQSGKKIKPFFLLRDAYLLHKACEAYAGKPMGELARIRKFVAVAASFRTREDIDDYISSIAPQHYNEWVICEQLLLPRELISQILNVAYQSPNPQHMFYQILHREDVMQIIFNNSAEARARLKKYILKEMKIEEGDTLVLIDTGYLGVTQEFLMRALGDELKIEIIGRYFIASHEPDRPQCKALMTSSWCEHGLFEQSCTYKEGSVLAYDEQGDPIFDNIKLSDQQYEKVNAIQNESIRFILNAKKFFSDAGMTLPYDILQKTAEAVLHRQVFFPTPEEIHYLQAFQHDKDMGNDSKKTIYNLDHAINMLEQSHLPYKAHPYEARAISLDLSLSSLMKRALDLEFSQEENSYYHEILKIIAIQNAQQAQVNLHAIKTLNGFYSCRFDILSCFHVGIVFGEAYEWVQIEKINLLINPEINILDDEKRVILNKIKKQKSLFECESKDSFLMLMPFNENNHVVSYQIIFRPIIRRS